MADLIDRQQAIDAMCDACSDWCDEGVCKKVSAIQRLPSAQPERKKGKWIDDGKGLYICSSCGKLWVHWWAKCVPLNQMCKELRYCPMCGADMRGESE